MARKGRYGREGDERSKKTRGEGRRVTRGTYRKVREVREKSQESGLEKYPERFYLLPILYQRLFLPFQFLKGHSISPRYYSGKFRTLQQKDYTRKLSYSHLHFRFSVTR